MIGKIFVAHLAADALEIGIHRAGGLAGIKLSAPIAADPFQRVGEIRVFKQRAFARSRGEVSLLRILIFFQHAAFMGRAETARAELPVIRDDFRDRRTLARIVDGGREILRHASTPETLVQGIPPVHRARHCDRHRAERR